MTAHDHVREMLAAPMRSPTNLAAYLGLRPLGDQIELLEAMLAAEGSGRLFETGELPTGGALRAVALYAMWRTISIHGSRTTVIAASGALGQQLMRFLYDVTMRTTPAMYNFARFRRWNHVEFGLASGWDIKLLHPIADHVAPRAAQSATAVILGASNSDPAFLEAQEALESGLVSPKKYVLRLW